MHGLHKLLLFHVLTCLGQNACGSEIIDGKIATENSMLYMVSLQNNKIGHFCGGFLISKDFVLTAAHCDFKRAHVVLGTHDLKSDDRTVRAIEMKCIHPSYEVPGTGNDLMLLKLSSEVQLCGRIQAIQLPSSEMNIKDNEKCTVAGWGYKQTAGGNVYKLRVVDVPVINPQVCNEEWDGLPANVICAGGYGTTKGSCNGDSGGPLVCNGTAVGVVSFGLMGNGGMANCDFPNLPDVYTDISRHLPWIKEILEKKSC